VAAIASVVVLVGCGRHKERSHVPIGPTELPSESYERPPETPFDSGDLVIKLQQMTSFYDVPGEMGYLMSGRDYGFDGLSFVLTETHPNGGPPLHTHLVEEAHVVLSGTMHYVVGDQRFIAEAPFIARVPAGVPHTFINGGTTSLNIIAVFPSRELEFTEVGPNPLVAE
jgi:mannose-6-phosphate isomerase-like protein (cupin superfamily)